MKAWSLVLFGGFSLLGIAACGANGSRDGDTSEAPSSIESTDTSPVCASGFSSFKTAFLPKIETEACVRCHKGANPSAPPWLVGKDSQIYSNAKNYVNFADLESSRLVIRAGNGHCGGDCNEAMRGRMRTYLQNWWDGGESTCDQSFRLRTQPVRVPADLPSDRFITLSWDLKTVDVSLRGVSMNVEIRKFTDAAGPVPGSYIIRRPRFIASQAIPVAVGRVRVLNNGTFQEATNQFERINAVVSPDVETDQAMSYPVLSAEQTIVVEQHPGTDELTLAFDKLARMPERRECKVMDQFRAKVMPTVQARSCLGCHTSFGAAASQTAISRFDMGGTDQELCAKFLARTWTDPNVLPPLIQYPLYGRFEHPRVLVGAKDVLPDWTDWAAAEWQ
jgi:hypothetical protein